jgi:hypothetical protein
MQGLIQPGAPYDAFKQVTDQQISSVHEEREHARLAHDQLSEVLRSLSVRERAAAELVLLEAFRMTAQFLCWTLQVRERIQPRDVDRN